MGIIICYNLYYPYSSKRLPESKPSSEADTVDLDPPSDTPIDTVIVELVVFTLVVEAAQLERSFPPSYSSSSSSPLSNLAKAALSSSITAVMAQLVVMLLSKVVLIW